MATHFVWFFDLAIVTDFSVARSNQVVTVQSRLFHSMCYARLAVAFLLLPRDGINLKLHRTDLEGWEYNVSFAGIIITPNADTRVRQRVALDLRRHPVRPFHTSVLVHIHHGSMLDRVAITPLPSDQLLPQHSGLW